MNRYEIILGKIPPPAVPALIPKPVPTDLDKIRENLLSGKFPFQVDDVVVREDREDPSVIHMDVLYRPIYPLNHITIKMKLNNSGILQRGVNRNNDVFSMPALGSDLHRRILSGAPQFIDCSWVASPPDPNARILSIDNPDSFPGITTGRFSGGTE